MTRLQQTQRPPDMYPEVWSMMSKNQRRIAAERWKTRAVELNKAREEWKAWNAGGDNNSEPGAGAGKPAQDKEQSESDEFAVPITPIRQRRMSPPPEPKN